MRLRRPRLPAFGSLTNALGFLKAAVGSLTTAFAQWLAARKAAGPRARTVLPAVLVVVIATVVPVGMLAADKPGVTLRGLPEETLVGEAELADLRVRVAAPGVRPADMDVRIDGKAAGAGSQVRATPRHEGLTLDLSGLADGRHTLAANAAGDLGLSESTVRRRFTVDTRPPRFDVRSQTWASSFTRAFTLEGTVSGATGISAQGGRGRLRREAFDVRVPSPPSTVRLEAKDAAGNTARAKVRVGVAHPGMRAVHMTAVSWTSEALREPILDLIRQGKIDTVELDIKDESGHVGYDSDVALADRIGADKGHYDVARVVDKLHDMGARVVGRLVCFRDPVLAEAAWTSRHRARVVQTPGGSAYSGGYGEYAFTNFANETVRQYNIDLAVEAAELGFDGILFDYVRRPDGPRQSMAFPGLSDGTTPSESVADFVARSAGPIHERGAFVGASVFGVAATRPQTVAQDIPRMAEHADYIAPMVYPSHWGPGEYGVADPSSRPYDIVRRSLRDFQKAVEGTDATVIPWLQDFSLGVAYGPARVHAQIRAARDVGIDSFLLWNAGASYTPDALHGR